MIPEQHRPRLAKVADDYRSPAPVTPDTRATAGLDWDAGALLSFRDHARSPLGSVL